MLKIVLILVTLALVFVLGITTLGKANKKLASGNSCKKTVNVCSKSGFCGLQTVSVC